jgi:2-phosphosulfolactate phosphatase
MSFDDQRGYPVRCEWGLEGLTHLLSGCQVVVLVDVLSFTTSVTTAVERGAWVYPFNGPPQAAEQFAASIGGVLAGRDWANTERFSLIPTSLLEIPAGTRLVLPSANGARLSLAAGDVPVIAACLRNARAAARAAQTLGEPILVVPAGERWLEAGGGGMTELMRPALEDLLGAGAVISHLNGRRSPEAAAAAAVYEGLLPNLLEIMMECSSGRELVARQREADVRYSAELDASQAAPVLVEGAYSLMQSP